MSERRTRLLLAPLLATPRLPPQTDTATPTTPVLTPSATPSATTFTAGSAPVATLAATPIASPTSTMISHSFEVANVGQPVATTTTAATPTVTPTMAPTCASGATDVSPATLQTTVGPGTHATYTHTISNLGGGTDTKDVLAVSAHGWTSRCFSRTV